MLKNLENKWETILQKNKKIAETSHSQIERAKAEYRARVCEDAILKVRNLISNTL